MAIMKKHVITMFKLYCGDLKGEIEKKYAALIVKENILYLRFSLNRMMDYLFMKYPEEAKTIFRFLGEYEAKAVIHQTLKIKASVNRLFGKNVSCYQISVDELGKRLNCNIKMGIFLEEE